MPRWNSYYNTASTYFSLLPLIFHPSPWQCSNSSVSPWCHYSFGNSSMYCLWRTWNATEHHHAYGYRWPKLTGYLEAVRGVMSLSTCLMHTQRIIFSPSDILGSFTRKRCPSSHIPRGLEEVHRSSSRILGGVYQCQHWLTA